MHTKSITTEQPIKVEFTFEDTTQLINFRDAFLKLCKTEDRPVAELFLDENSRKVTYHGRMDVLCHLWYISGAFAERSFSTKNLFKKLILN